MMTTIAAEDFVLKYRPAWRPAHGWACVAGGYLRDAVLGISWGDVDLFVRRYDKDPHQPMFLIVCEKDKTFGFWQQEYEPAPGWEKFLLLRDGGEDYDEERYISFAVAGIPSLNVIFRLDELASPEELVAQFPCTASMVWWDYATKQVRMFAGFADSIRSKVFTYAPECRQAYFSKLAHRPYPPGTVHRILQSDEQWQTTVGQPK